MDNMNLTYSNQGWFSRYFFLIAIITFLLVGLFSLSLISFDFSIASCRSGMQCEIVKPLSIIFTLVSPLLIALYASSALKRKTNQVTFKSISVKIYFLYLITSLFMLAINLLSEQTNRFSCEVDKIFFDSRECYNKYAFSHRNPEYCYGDEICIESYFIGVNDYLSRNGYSLSCDYYKGTVFDSYCIRHSVGE